MFPVDFKSAESRINRLHGEIRTWIFERQSFLFFQKLVRKFMESNISRSSLPPCVRCHHDAAWTPAVSLGKLRGDVANEAGRSSLFSIESGSGIPQTAHEPAGGFVRFDCHFPSIQLVLERQHILRGTWSSNCKSASLKWSAGRGGSKTPPPGAPRRQAMVRLCAPCKTGEP